MDTLIPTLLLLGAGVWLLYVIVKTKRTLPPGPRGWPLIGNILDVPQDRPWLAYQRWSREYDSDLIYCNMAGTHVYVINSARVAFDLLEKRSSIYSDRPLLTLFNVVLDSNWTFSTTRYNEWWREHRRMFHQYFHPTATLQFKPQITKSARKLIRRLLDIPEPEDLIAQLRLMSSTTVMDITYGFKAESADDPYIVIAEKGMHAISEVASGTYLVDTLPFLRYFPSWFPGAGFKRYASSWKADIEAMKEKPFAAVKAALGENSVASPSMVTSLLGDLSTDSDNSRQETLIKEVAGMTYGAGSDTTAFVLTSFVFAMLKYPDVQRKAHEELDRVVGRSRPPVLSDQISLPYITALIIETLRWRPILPTALPRRLMADDDYEGYHLHKGSTIIANSWAILHDDRIYEEPATYNPERYLTEDGLLNTDAKVTTSASFGYGRRICAGRYFTELSLWINIASLLWTFDITKVLDNDGNVVEPSEKFTIGLIVHPEPFKCCFKPRSHSVAEIARTYDLDTE